MNYQLGFHNGDSQLDTPIEDISKPHSMGVSN